jgi:hypothetical protein
VSAAPPEPALTPRGTAGADEVAPEVGVVVGVAGFAVVVATALGVTGGTTGGFALVVSPASDVEVAAADGVAVEANGAVVVVPHEVKMMMIRMMTMIAPTTAHSSRRRRSGPDGADPGPGDAPSVP